jgi:hypothetical protein
VRSAAPREKLQRRASKRWSFAAAHCIEDAHDQGAFGHATLLLAMVNSTYVFAAGCDLRPLSELATIPAPQGAPEQMPDPGAITRDGATTDTGAGTA